MLNNIIDRNKKMNKLIIIINSIIVIIILAFIIYWLNKIKACVCASKIAEKKYLKEWFIIQIILIIIYMMIIIITNGDLSKSTINSMAIFYIIITIIDLIMLIRLFIYIKKIRELKCNCGMLETQNYIYNYLIFVFSIVSFILFIFLLIGIYILIMRFSKSKNKKIR